MAKSIFTKRQTPAHDAIAGRQREQRTLRQALESGVAEFIAIYGRRRVGKTYLVHRFFSERELTYTPVTGEHGASTREQLRRFQKVLEQRFYHGAPLPELRTWADALELMGRAVQIEARRDPKDPIVLFFDEVPWLATPKSGLLAALDHVWNTVLSRLPNVKLIVCGSAASFMLEKFIQGKGGLHNRITRRLRLDPFSLAETREFLRGRRIKLSNAQILELYLAFGGIPHYLAQVERGESAAQAIGRICFDRSGALSDEFNRLFQSLFRNADSHIAIVRALAKRKSGLLRAELIADTKIASGGTLAKRLKELEEAGFVASFAPYGKKIKQTTYRLIDEYVLFYLNWIERAPRGVLSKGGQRYWLAKTGTPGYRSWAGIAFEGVCLKHAPQIQTALGLVGTSVEVGTWRFVPAAGSRQAGAQVDLLFDRADKVITLCELKYADEKYTITKSYARDLKRKIEVFETQTKTKKDVFLAIVTTKGLKQNAWSEDLVQNVVVADQLFEAK